MNPDDFSSSIVVGGETYDYDPKRKMALVPCENCGHLNGVDVYDAESDNPSFSSFSCENCGHWNSFD